MITARHARRYECIYAISVHCTRGDGTPKRKKCAHCGGALMVLTGLWGAFIWTGDGRYPESAALATFTREAQAQAYADERQANTVVRWIFQ